jgi:hypothetical protein
MKPAVRWVMPVLLVLAAVASRAQTRVELETLEPVRCTQGGTGPVNMVEAGFGEPGVYGGDIVVHWTGMESDEAVLEYRIQVAAAGRQRVVVGLAKSWDYGIYQFALNGADVGDPVDLATGGEPEIVVPAELDLGPHDLGAGPLLLGLRFVGESPRAKAGPNPGSVGLDYVRLLPAGAVGSPAGGSGATGFEIEKLPILQTSEGATAEVDLVDMGFTTTGVFGADTVVFWFGVESPGAVLEFRVPVAVAGRYQVTIGLTKSWDYGVYQARLDGQDAGPSLDLASAREPGQVYPLTVQLGAYDLQPPSVTLGFRLEGASPQAQEGPNPMSGAFDWVRLTPAVALPNSGAR